MFLRNSKKSHIAGSNGTFNPSLSEERSMADWIKTNMPDMVAELWSEIEAPLAMLE